MSYLNFSAHLFVVLTSPLSEKLLCSSSNSLDRSAEEAEKGFRGDCSHWKN